MKKFKKALAVILTMAMVMGLGMTAFAAENATITINNAGAGKFSYVQVIEADQTTDTGWDFVDGYAQYFTAADAFNTNDTQAIIKGLIYAEDPTAKEGKKIENFVNKYAAALQNVWETLSANGQEDATIDVNKAGLYVIRGSETNFNYTPMAVFIGMDSASGKPSGVVGSASVEAKKSPTHIEKKVDDTIVETNQEVTYTVTSTVPYFPDQDTNRWYVIKDTISGAEYKLNDDNTTMTVNVKVGDVDAPELNKNFAVTPGEGTFALDLTDSKCENFLDLANNTYANKTITITYKAIVTGLVIDNDVIIGDGTNEGDDKYGSDHEDVISGTVTLVKTDDNDVENNRIPLAGAEFVVQKTNDNGTPDDKTDDTVVYAKFDNNNYLTGWVTDMSTATVLTTNDEGKITVNGLAPDTAYEFKETKAPEGYSINETNAKVTWSDTNITEEDISDPDAAPIEGEASMVDTKLASLPGTGGIGTTIFTIGGCGIMIVAAGLYFASRRRQESR